VPITNARIFFELIQKTLPQMVGMRQSAPDAVVGSELKQTKGEESKKQ